MPKLRLKNRKTGQTIVMDKNVYENRDNTLSRAFVVVEEIKELKKKPEKDNSKNKKEAEPTKELPKEK